MKVIREENCKYTLQFNHRELKHLHYMLWERYLNLIYKKDKKYDQQIKDIRRMLLAMGKLNKGKFGNDINKYGDDKKWK